MKTNKKVENIDKHAVSHHMFVIVTLMMEAQNIDFVVAVIVVIKIEENVTKCFNFHK